MGISENMEYGHNNIVEFRTNQIKPFKTLFDSIKNNLPDTSIYFTKDGLKILQLDSAGNFLVNVFLQGENFEHYYCDTGNSDGIIEINLSTIHLTQAFKCLGKTDNVFCFIYERDKDYVQLVFSSDRKSECRTYEIRIQRPEDEMQMAEIEGVQDFPYCLTMTCDDLQRICRDFKAHGCKRLTIAHDGNSVKFSSCGSVKITIERYDNKTPGSVQFLKLPEQGSNTPHYEDVFKFSTINEFSKCPSGSDTKLVKMMLSQGDPIVLYFEIGTLGTMAVAVAPYISSEVR